jgi:hypothetical protein
MTVPMGIPFGGAGFLRFVMRADIVAPALIFRLAKENTAAGKFGDLPVLTAWDAR